MPRITESPHLEDGTTYRPLRPTRLDEIENFHAEVQADDVRCTTLDTVKSIPFAVFPDSAPGVSGQKG